MSSTSSTSPNSSDKKKNNKKRRLSSNSSIEHTIIKDNQYRAVIKRIDDLEDTIKNAFNRLTEEVISLRREVNRKCTVEATPVEKLIPAAAITSPEHLAELEDKLRDTEAFNTLVRDLMSITGSSSSEFVRNCWHSIIEDGVSQNYTWYGSKGKKAAKDLIVAAAIKASFQRKYPTEPLEVMEQRSKKYFQYAKDRITKKIKYHSQQNQ